MSSNVLASLIAAGIGFGLATDISSSSQVYVAIIFVLMLFIKGSPKAGEEGISGHALCAAIFAASWTYSRFSGVMYDTSTTVMMWTFAGLITYGLFAVLDEYQGRFEVAVLTFVRTPFWACAASTLLVMTDL